LRVCAAIAPVTGKLCSQTKRHGSDEAENDRGESRRRLLAGLVVSYRFSCGFSSPRLLEESGVLMHAHFIIDPTALDSAG
jgi:hypothetical protein